MERVMTKKFNPTQDILFAGDKMAVKPFVTKAEREKRKEVMMKTITILSFILSMLIAGVYHAIAEMFLFWVGVGVVAYLAKTSFEHDPKTEKRKRMTLTQERIERKREYNAKQKVRNEKEAKLERQAQLDREMKEVDDRLQKAMEPVDFSPKEEFTPNWVRMKQSKKTVNRRISTTSRVKRKATKAKAFKKLSVDDI